MKYILTLIAGFAVFSIRSQGVSYEMVFYKTYITDTTISFASITARERVIKKSNWMVKKIDTFRIEKTLSLKEKGTSARTLTALLAHFVQNVKFPVPLAHIANVVLNKVPKEVHDHPHDELLYIKIWVSDRENTDGVKRSTSKYGTCIVLGFPGGETITGWFY